jgi:hypothetical protein
MNRLVLVFFLEERSVEALLQTFLPKFLPAHVQFRCHVFEGKQDLEKNLRKKLLHYTPTSQEALKFIVLRDKDNEDCVTVKRNLINIVRDAKKQQDTLVRIVCRELESWYLADLAAVGKALGLPKIHEQQNKKIYSSPDSLPTPVRHLKRLTKENYQKIAGSRLIGQYLDPNNIRSVSFKNFIIGINRQINSI